MVQRVIVHLESFAVPIIISRVTVLRVVFTYLMQFALKSAFLLCNLQQSTRQHRNTASKVNVSKNFHLISSTHLAHTARMTATNDTNNQSTLYKVKSTPILKY